jgi:F-type H+-transporting ATPase subunit epsilon
VASFALEIVTPGKTVYSGQVESLKAPGSEGSFGVLAGHVPFLTSLQAGSLSFDEEGGERCQMVVSGGFAQVANGVTVLAETAERVEEIDIARARAALERAEERLNSGAEDVDSARAEAAMVRALSRLTACGQA